MSGNLKHFMVLCGKNHFALVLKVCLLFACIKEREVMLLSSFARMCFLHLCDYFSCSVFFLLSFWKERYFPGDSDFEVYGQVLNSCGF